MPIVNERQGKLGKGEGAQQGGTRRCGKLMPTAVQVMAKTNQLQLWQQVAKWVEPVG